MIWTSPVALGIRRLTRHLGLNRIMGKWMQGSRYEDRFGAALLSAIKPGDVVWDIGANVGLYSELFLKKAGALGAVVAFEPATECYQSMVDRFATEPNFFALNVAMGATDGMVVMEMSSDVLAPTHRVILDNGGATGRTRTIPVKSAKSVCAAHPDWFPNVVKVDVEGHEGDVFEGFGEVLQDKRLHAVGVEVHFGVLQDRGEAGTPRKLESMLREAGLSVRWTDPSHIVASRYQLTFS
jgi:FkbM family methyltransferase